MDREYEIFECLSDGSIVWSTRASGLHDARLKLERLLRATGKEYFAIHLPTRDVVFAADASKVASTRAAKRIFQVTYDERLRLERAELLRGLGYAVMSVTGNEAAKTLLTSILGDNVGIALFIIGHAARAETRQEMVDWLKANFPGAKILALNPPDQQLPDADCNVVQNGPEAWLPYVAATMGPSQAT
jgi:hypothetical protein